MKATSGFGYFMRRGGAPATYALIGVALGVFVLSWLMQGRIQQALMFWSDWSRPWGLLTYPFASSGDGQGLFWFLIELYWLFWVGSSTEVDLGTGRFLAFFFSLTVLAALFVWVGLRLVRPQDVGGLGGLELGIAGLTVAWGARHPHQSILLFAIIPIPGWLLAWLTVALTLFGFGSMYRAPLMGFFACLHLAGAYLYATGRIPGLTYSRHVSGPDRQQAKRTEQLNKRYADDIRRREKEREERERLRKLFEGSIQDENDK